MSHWSTRLMEIMTPSPPLREANVYTEEDAVEVEKLLASAVRPNVKKMLESQLQIMRSQIAEAVATTAEGVRYNDVQWKAAHNSVERNETIFQQMDPADGKCGAIELDFVVDPSSVEILNTKHEADKLDQREIEVYEGWRFSVQHEDKYNNKSTPMHEVLRSLCKWSEEHPQHDVVTIHLDMKGGAAYHGSHQQFVLQLDYAILWGLGRERLFTPSDLQRDAPSLLEGVRTYGWPTLQELQNKFILVISGSDVDPPVRERRNIYASTNSTQRLCFVDIDQRGCSVKSQNSDITNEHYQKGDRVFVNIQLGNNNWQKLGKDAYKSGFISRVWKANKQGDWDMAKSSNIHFIATDKIRNHKWASINTSNSRNYSEITLS